MNDQNTVWIIVAIVVAVGVLVALALVARNRQTQKRREEVRTLREGIESDAAKADKRQALAAETEARARAAEAEAEAKAAEAQRLRERATAHDDSISATREELAERRQRADHLDPDVKTPKRTDDATAARNTAEPGRDADEPDRVVVDSPPTRGQDQG